MCDTVSFWMDGWMDGCGRVSSFFASFRCLFYVTLWFFVAFLHLSKVIPHPPFMVLWWFCSFALVLTLLCLRHFARVSATCAALQLFPLWGGAANLLRCLCIFFFWGCSSSVWSLFCLFVLSVSFLCQKWLVCTVCARLSTSVIHLWLYDHVCLFCVFILVLHGLCLEVEAVLLKMRSLSDLSTSVMSPLFQNWQAESNTPFLKRKSLLHDFVACLYSPQTLSRDTVNTHTLTTESVRCSCSRRSSPDCKKKREEGSWTLCGSFCLYSQICHFLRLTNPGMHWAWR